MQNNCEIKNDELYQELLVSLKTQVFVIPDIHGAKYKKKCGDIAGGGFPMHFDLNAYQSNFIENPDDKSVGIIMFPRSHNFFMIFPSKIPNKDIVQFSQEETIVISTGIVLPMGGQELPVGL